MTRVLVTGASGFVGRVLCDLLSEHGLQLRTALRRDVPPGKGATEHCVVGEIDARTHWDGALENVDHVVHLAARVHVLHDAAGNSPLYAETNAEGTRHLAEAAVRAGVRRLIYVSSIKVNGEETDGGPFTPEDEPHPMDAYGASKLLGEKYLRQLAKQSSLQV